MANGPQAKKKKNQSGFIQNQAIPLPLFLPLQASSIINNST